MGQVATTQEFIYLNRDRLNQLYEQATSGRSGDLSLDLQLGLVKFGIKRPMNGLSDLEKLRIVEGWLKRIGQLQPIKSVKPFCRSKSYAEASLWAKRILVPPIDSNPSFAIWVAAKPFPRTISEHNVYLLEGSYFHEQTEMAVRSSYSALVYLASTFPGLVPELEPERKQLQYVDYIEGVYDSSLEKLLVDLGAQVCPPRVIRSLFYIRSNFCDVLGERAGIYGYPLFITAVD